MQEWYECNTYDRHHGQAPDALSEDDPEYTDWLRNQKSGKDWDSWDEYDYSEEWE